MHRRPSAYRLALLALLALAVAAVAVAAEGGGSTESSSPLAASAWRGLVGGPRPEAVVGQRTIVVLKAPSLAVRVARARGRTTEDEQRRWNTVALAAQRQLIARLAARGIRVIPEFTYTKVLSGFSAALDPRAIAVLERLPEVDGVYPVRLAYPAARAARLLARGEVAAGASYRHELTLPGFDGGGVTVALLDTGVDGAHGFLAGRVQDGFDVVDGDDSARAERSPETAALERHGTQLAGLVAGADGPGGLAGAAPGAAILPVRVAGWQQDAHAKWSVYARTDQVVAGLERAVDPNDDGDTHDAPRVALLGVAEPYGAFPDSPTARAVAGALALDVLVVAPAGNDGPAGAHYGSLSGPGGARAALTVAAADLRRGVQDVRVTIRTGLDVELDRRLPLAGAGAPRGRVTLTVVAPDVTAASPLPGREGASLPDLFDDDGYSLVAGRAALVPAGESPADAAAAATEAGAAAVLLYGTTLPAGGAGLREGADVPVVAVPQEAAEAVRDALARGDRVSVVLGAARVRANPHAGRVALFSSRGLAFDGRVKPDVTAAGVGLVTSDAGRNPDGSSRYGTISGSSAAAALAAGTAALLLQARPELRATSLKSLLVGSAQPLGGEPVAAQGAGLLDVGGAAAGEVAATPGTLAFAGKEAGGPVTRRLLVRNFSPRRVEVQIVTPRAGVVVLAASPRRLSIAPRATATAFVTARVAYSGRGTELLEGALEIRSTGATAVRVPWLVTFERRGSLLGDVRISEREFRPSDSAPAVVSLRAGRIVRTAAGDEVQPIARLDLELRTAKGKRLGLLARVRDGLPGRYAFGLTGRDPGGEALRPGRYRLVARAFPTGRGRASTASVAFRIR